VALSPGVRDVGISPSDQEVKPQILCGHLRALQLNEHNFYPALVQLTRVSPVDDDNDYPMTLVLEPRTRSKPTASTTSHSSCSLALSPPAPVYRDQETSRTGRG